MNPFRRIQVNLHIHKASSSDLPRRALMTERHLHLYSIHLPHRIPRHQPIGILYILIGLLNSIIKRQADNQLVLWHLCLFRFLHLYLLHDASMLLLHLEVINILIVLMELS